eukprot:jgi/Ulvmu1/1995/UM012_0157.1
MCMVAYARLMFNAAFSRLAAVLSTSSAIAVAPSKIFWQAAAATPGQFCTSTSQSPTATMAARTILWFRNDLRLRDNVAVAEAAASGGDVVPIFCFDDRFMSAQNVLDRRPHARKLGDTKMGTHRAQFQLESVNALREALQNIGSDLLVFYDRPENVIPGLLSDTGKDTVLASEEVMYEEVAVDHRVRGAISGRAKLRTVWNATLYHVEDLPYSADLSDMPDTFTPARKKIEAQCDVREEAKAPRKGDLSLPAAVRGQGAGTAVWDQLPLAPEVKAAGPPKPHPDAALHFQGGEAAALARLKYYLWDSDCVATYFDTRNGMIGGDYSTKFSPWLADGCLSPRTVYHELKRYEAARTENKSTYWVVFELLWRDYFKFFCIKHGTRIFFEGGIIAKQLPWTSDEELFELWKAGRTGLPLVDANMRELAATGFMSNRGRQNVASYLILDLGVDWRRGAAWFEHHLLDHDVASNWGNWLSAAGLTGGRINKFNIVKQSKDYDEGGEYVKHWLPELRPVPTAYVHEPWTMPDKVQQECGVVVGRDYPRTVPVSRMARPWGGARYPEDGGKGAGGGRSPKARGRGARQQARAQAGNGRRPVNFY